MKGMVDQNQMLLDVIKNGGGSKAMLSALTEQVYMKNVLKFTSWDTKEKRTIETFITECEVYCNASGYNGDGIE